jgi:hypothetical protein
LEFDFLALHLSCLKGVLDSKNGMKAEIIPNEPEQVMLLREKTTKTIECTLFICHRKQSHFNLTKRIIPPFIRKLFTDEHFIY